MPANDPSYYKSHTHSVAPGDKFHTMLPTPYTDVMGNPFPQGQQIPEPPIYNPASAVWREIGESKDRAGYVQDLLKQLRERLAPALRDAEPVPVSQEAKREPVSPLASEIRQIGDSVSVAIYIANDILARLEV